MSASRDADTSHDDMGAARAPLWAAVDEALDAGAPVLDDPRVQAWLVEHPEDLARVDELLARLDLIAVPKDAPRREGAHPSDPPRVLPSPLRHAASIGLLGFVLFFAWRAVGGASAPAADPVRGAPVLADASGPPTGPPAGPAFAPRASARRAGHRLSADSPRERVLWWSVRSTSVGSAGRVEHVARRGRDVRRVGATTRPGASSTPLTEPSPSARGRIIAATFRSSTWSSR